jgi:predicted RNase H-like nuclease
MSEHVGVDGCRFGWVAVFEERAQLGYRLFRRFDELAANFSQAGTILVDIPIGLPWAGCPTRPCDTLARKQLGPGRASSVFPAPSRAACNASDVGEARRLNIAELGRSLSAQAWGICAKVAEVDKWLLANPATRHRVGEIHPEVCFWALNGRRPMRHAKSSAHGLAERMAALTTHEPRSQALLHAALREQRRSELQADDVLDALVAFLTSRSARGEIQRLQGNPAHDLHGLPMEMLHP